jgi:glycerate dehydrogenase
MHIVVLDGYTLNPGDLSWGDLHEIGALTVHEHTLPEQIVDRACQATFILTNKTPLNKETIDKLPELKYIGVLATGYNIVDVDYAKQLGIVVTNVPTYGTRSVAQMVFALLLEMCHHVQHHANAVRHGTWSQSRDFCFWHHPLIELSGKTMGIVGFGRIGEQTANLAEAFGMKVMGYNRTRSDQSHRNDFRWAELAELFTQSDVISLHVPLVPETKGMINKHTLAMMKPSAFLINTSRGPLIVDDDLADALNQGVIAGAALDVLSVEPPPLNNPLIYAKNCIITPHISWATFEARKRLMQTAIDNVKSYLQGNRMNVVNP